MFFNDSATGRLPCARTAPAAGGGPGPTKLYSPAGSRLRKARSYKSERRPASRLAQSLFASLSPDYWYQNLFVRVRALRLHPFSPGAGTVVLRVPAFTSTAFMVSVRRFSEHFIFYRLQF